MTSSKEIVKIREAEWSREQFPDSLSQVQLAVLEGLRRGHSRRASCAICNVSMLIFDHWMRYDKVFAAAAAWAEASNENSLVDKVNASQDWRASVALLQARYPETWASPDQQLNLERKKAEQQKLEANIAAAQARELETRAERNVLEASMWQKQFVTEEQQEDMIRKLASVVNKPLMHLTPEKFSELVGGKNPEEQLEILKGFLGVEQSRIVEEVLTGSYEDEEETNSLEEETEETEEELPND